MVYRVCKACRENFQRQANIRKARVCRGVGVFGLGLDACAGQRSANVRLPRVNGCLLGDTRPVAVDIDVIRRTLAVPAAARCYDLDAVLYPESGKSRARTRN